MKFLLSRLCIVLVFVIFSIYAQNTDAATGAPRILNYQGRLMDASGNVLGGSGTNYCFRFSIYDNPVAGSGTKLWPAATPSTMTISVKKGVFNAGVGDTGAGGDTLDYNFQDSDTVYLNVDVATLVGPTCAPGDGAEVYESLSPRQRLLSSAYTVNASTVGGFTPSQSASANQIPVLNATGNLILSASAAGISATTTNALTVQGASSGDIRFFNSSNRLNSSGTMTLGGSLFLAGGSGTSSLQSDMFGTSTLQGFLQVLGVNSTSTFAGGLSTQSFAVVGSATSTFANGVSLGGGCFSINGVCLQTGFATSSADYYVQASSTIPKTYTSNSFTATQSFSNASTTNISSSYASSTQGFFGSLFVGSLSGILKATAGAVSSSLVNLAADITGVLGISNGGTGTSTAPVLGKLLVGNASGGYDFVATSTLGNAGTITALGTGYATTSSGAVMFGTSTIGSDFSITGSGQQIIFALPSSSSFNRGLVTSTDWNTFNTKISSSSLSGGTGVAYNPSTGIISNTIGYAFPGNATSTQLSFNGGFTTTNATFNQATTSSFAITNIPSSLLKTLSNGAVVAAIAGTDYQAPGNYASFAYPFIGNATATPLSFNGGATFVGATTTALSVTGSTTVAGQFNAVGGVTLGPTTVNGTITLNGATTTATNGINLSAGCFSVNGSCISGSSGTNVVLSAVRTNTATSTWTVPTNLVYAVVELWGGGGGGGGGGTTGAVGGNGGLTNFGGLATSTGGTGGRGQAGSTIVVTGGAGGNGFGGDVTMTGGTGGSATSTVSGFGGSAPRGGQGATGGGNTGNIFGGGGSGASNITAGRLGGGGGGGGYTEKVFTASQLIGTTSIQIGVGLGGIAGIGAGTTPSSGGAGGAGGYIIYEYTASNVSTGNGSINTGTTGQVAFYNANGTALSGTSELFVDTSNGRIGIGSTTPGADLAVAGSAIVTGKITTTDIFATGTLSVLGQTILGNASTTNISANYASSTLGYFGSLFVGSLSGILKATAGAVTSSLVNLASDITGVLGIANGGTGTSTAPTLGKILVGNATGGYDYVATSTLGNSGTLTALGTGYATTTSGAITFATSTLGSDFSITNSGQQTIFNLPSATQANRGLLTSADWNTFNTKLSSSSLSAGNGIGYDSSSGVISNTIGYAFPGNATSTNITFSNGVNVGGTVTTTNLTIAALPSTLLKTNALGQLVAAVSGTDYQQPGNYATFAYPFQNNATSTTLTFNSGLVSVGSTTVNGTLNATNLSLSNALTSSNGGTGISSPVAAGILLGNYAGTGYQQLATSSLGLLTTNVAEGSNQYYTDTRARNALSSTAIGITYTSATGVLSLTGGYTIPLGASTTDWNTAYINRITSANAPLSITGNTLSINQASAGANGYLTSSDFTTFANKISSTSLSGGSGISYNSATGVIANTIGYSFPGNATTTNLTFSNGISVGGTATTSNLIVTSLPSSLLKTNSLGQLVAAVAGTDYQAPGNYATFAYPFPNNATTTTLALTKGALLVASTTVGDGTAAGGLTIAGVATTSGNLVVQGSGTSTFAGGIAITGGCILVSGSCLTNGGGTGSGFSTTSADYYITASTSIVKTNTANSFTQKQNFTDASTTNISSNYASSTTANFGSVVIGTLGGILKATAGVVSSSFVNLASDVTGILGVSNGGTGWANLAANTLLTGNGSGAVATTTIGNSLQLSGGTLALNIANANLWTGLQSFTNASTSVQSVFTKAYFGGTATTTIDSAGNVVVAGSLTALGNASLGSATSTNFFATSSVLSRVSASQATSTALFISSTLTGAGLSACANTTDKLLWNAGSGQFSCGPDTSFATSSADYYTINTNTIAKTNVANSFTATQTFTNASTTNISASYASSTLGYFGSLSIGALSGILKATAGVVASSLVNLSSDVSGILSVANGGTGWASLAANTLLTGNGSGGVATTTVGSSLQLSGGTLSLNLASNNQWTGLQDMDSASTTLLESMNQYARMIQSTSTNALVLRTNFSSTAGLVLGSTSTPQMLGLDTINNRVTVGTGGGTPSLFVLDTKNTAGDPAVGIDGAQYYNSNSGMYRCYAGGVWRTCGGQAASSTGDVQINNTDGSFTASSNFNWSLASNGLTIKGNSGQLADLFSIASSTGAVMFSVSSGGIIKLATTTDPATPASGINIYAKEIAGRVLPKWVGPSGVDTPFQANLGFNRVAMVNPAGGTVAASTVTAVSTAFTNQTVGSITYNNPVPATTNLLTSTRRTTFSTGATANTMVYHRQNTLMVTRGNAAGIGGFFYTIRFGTSALAAGNRIFVGLTDSIGTPTTGTDALASTTPGKVGMAINANTGNWKFVWNVTGSTPTVVDLGASFPVDTTSLYELIMFSKPNGTAITWRVTNLSTNAVVSSTTATTNIPSGTTFLAPEFWSTNVAATASTIDFGGWYLESDN